MFHVYWISIHMHHASKCLNIIVLYYGWVLDKRYSLFKIPSFRKYKFWFLVKIICYKNSSCWLIFELNFYHKFIYQCKMQKLFLGIFTRVKRFIGIFFTLVFWPICCLPGKVGRPHGRPHQVASRPGGRPTCTETCTLATALAGRPSGRPTESCLLSVCLGRPGGRPGVATFKNLNVGRSTGRSTDRAKLAKIAANG